MSINLEIRDGFMVANYKGPSNEFQKFLSAVKSVPGRVYDKSSRSWKLPLTGLCAEELKLMLKSFEYEKDFPDEIEKLLRGRRLFYRILNEKEWEKPIAGTKLESKPHQARGSRLIASTDSVYLAWDMGTGKTKAVIDAVVAAKLKNVIVACPKAVIGHWGREWAKHGSGDRRVLLLGKKKGRQSWLSVKEKTKLLIQALSLPEPLLVVVNYQSMWRGELGALIKSVRWDLGVADEATHIKGGKSKVSIFFDELRSSCDRRAALSGTPIQSTREDLFAQCRFLDPGVYGLQWSYFTSKYCEVDGNGAIIYFKDKDNFRERFHRIAYRVHRDEVLSLPEFTHQTRTVQMGEKARKIMNEISSSFMVHLEEGSITVENALVEIIRMQQIASGGIKFDEDDKVTIIDDAKKLELISLFEELSEKEPVVVFCTFHFELDMIHEAAKETNRTSCELSGRRDDHDEWQDADVLDQNVIDAKYLGTPPTILAVQVQAGSMGPDFTRACYDVALSWGFSYGLVKQALKRTDRMGQTRPGFHIRISAEDSIDIRVDRVLERKGIDADAVVDYDDRVGADKPTINAIIEEMRKSAQNRLVG